MSEEAARPARPDELPEVLDLLECANPHLSQRFTRFRRTGVTWAEATAMLYKTEGVLQSVALIFRRKIRIGRGSVAFGGVGAVATRREMQGRGFAKAVLKACEQLLANERFPLAILFCSIPQFYERLGWTTVPTTEQNLPLPAPIGGLRFECASLASVPPDIRTLYETSGTGAIVRPPQLWCDYHSWLREDEDLFQAAYRGNRLLGYARARRCENGLELLEATGEAISPLLFELLLCAGERRFVPSSNVMMIKALTQAEGASAGHLSLEDFGGGPPWSPRTWWPIDRF